MNASRIVTFSVLSALGITMAGCSGFEAAKPDPNQFMWITNTAIAKVVYNHEKATPLPLPILPGPAPIADEPFVQPSQDPSPLEPRDMGSGGKVGVLGTPQPIDPNVPPYLALGKLEFDEGGKPYYCTGQIVGDVLMTAGHCVFSNHSNKWNTNFEFKLGYKNGGFNQLYDWQCSATYSGWAQNSYKYDFAFIKLRGTTANALGMKVGLPATSWESIGYPKAYDGGQIPWSVLGNRGGVKFGVVEMTGNPFGGGSSGGAWLSGNYVIGVNSHGYSDKPNSMFGPLLDGKATALYEFVRRGCTSDVVPPGTDPKIASYDKNNFYIDTDTMIVDSPVSLRRTSSPAACPCPDSEEWILENKSEKPYTISLDYAGNSGNPPKLIDTGSTSLRSEPGEPRSLGCSLGDSKGQMCEVAVDWSIKSMRRSLQVFHPNGLIETRSVAPDFCADQCLNNPDGGYCLSYGSAAKPIIGALAGFVTDMLDKTPNADGVTVTKEDMIKSFGGDPKTDDLCHRSDFYKSNEEVRNDGIACVTTTPKIVDLPDEARISLRSPALGIAQRIASPGAVGSAASFADRGRAPFLEFYGASSAQINQLYGGKVAFVERRNKRLIITTENGCSAGDDAP